MKTILARTMFEPEIAETIADAMIETGDRKHAYWQVSLSDQYIAEHLANKKLKADEIISLVDRPLGPKARAAYVQRNEKRVTVHEAFLMNNTLTTHEADVFFERKPDVRSVDELLRLRGAQLERETLQKALERCTSAYTHMMHLAAYDTLDLEFLESLLCKLAKEAETQNNSHILYMLGRNMRLIGGKHPYILELAEKLYSRNPELYGEAYCGAVSSAQFETSAEFERHFEAVMLFERGWRVRDSLVGLALNPSVTFTEAQEVLDTVDAHMLTIASKQSLTYGSTEPARKQRQGALEQGFNVWRGRIEDVPEELHEGLLSLVTPEVTQTRDAVPTTIAVEVLKNVKDRDRRIELARKHVKNSPSYLHRWFVEELDLERGDVYLYNTSTNWVSLPRTYPQGPHYKVEPNSWVQYAVQELGTDTVAWKTLLVLGESVEEGTDLKQVVDVAKTLSSEK